MTFDKVHVNNLLTEIEKLIKDGKSSDNIWIPLKDVCRYSSLSDSTIRRAVRRGTLKASTSTGRLLFKKSNVDKWLTS